MASGMVAKINFKNMDYFKFKRIVIDGNRDDYPSCSRELRMLCDSVQTLAFRDDQFADEEVLSSNESHKQIPSSDTHHFDEILSGYRQILAGKRIDPLDIRVKTGWWADNATSSTGTAGKFKMAALRDTLLSKSNEWRSRHSSTPVSPQVLDDLDLPGVFVFKHRERQCFQFVGRALTSEKSVFAVCNELLKASFEGVGLTEPLNALAALLVVSMAADWDFYFISASLNENDTVLRIIENDIVLRHDSIWPRGLNRMLHVTSPLEVAQLRSSCLRHRWPPAESVDVQLAEIDIDRVRSLVKNASALVTAIQLPVTSCKPSTRPPSTTSAKSTERSHNTPSIAVPQHTRDSPPIGHDVITPNHHDQVRSSDAATHKPQVVAATARHQRSAKVPAASSKTSTASSIGVTSRTRPASAPRPSGPATSHQPRLSAGDPSSTASRPKSATSTARRDPVAESTSLSNCGSKTRRTSESVSRSSASLAATGHGGVSPMLKKTGKSGAIRSNAKPSPTNGIGLPSSPQHRVDQMATSGIPLSDSSTTPTLPVISASVSTTSSDSTREVTSESKSRTELEGNFECTVSEPLPVV